MNTYSVTVYLDPWDALFKSFNEKELFEQIWGNMSDDTFDAICAEISAAISAAIGLGMSEEDVDFSEKDFQCYVKLEDDWYNIGSFRYDLSDEEFLAIDVYFTIDVDSYVEDHVR